MLLKKDKLDELLAALAREQAVYVPKRVAGQLKFTLLDNPGEMALGAGNTLFPPKDLLFPQAEKMYAYGVDADGAMFVRQTLAGGPQTIFGLRPCDMRSIECLDDVFFTKGYVDEYYEAKREKTCCVALACTQAAETCFCESMGNAPDAAPAADIMLHDCGDAYAVAAQTETGEAALAGAWKPFLSEGDGGAGAGAGERANTDEAAQAHCSLQVDAEHIGERIAGLADSDELWEATAIKCLNCGTCTYLCPTCYCFDIEQANRNKEGVRFRCWDSCMFSEYTEMAGGHNPRPAKRDRVKNRFMHKLAWFEERYGKKLCVGCGRCIEKCPVALDITVLIDRVNDLHGKEAAHA